MYTRLSSSIRLIRGKYYPRVHILNDNGSKTLCGRHIKQSYIYNPSKDGNDLMCLKCEKINTKKNNSI